MNFDELIVGALIGMLMGVVLTALCGECGRAWDDDKATAWTPAPASRCPFEYMHNGNPCQTPTQQNRPGVSP